MKTPNPFVSAHGNNHWRIWFVIARVMYWVMRIVQAFCLSHFFARKMNENWTRAHFK